MGYKATITVELDDEFMFSVIESAGYGCAYWAESMPAEDGWITVHPDPEFRDEYPSKRLSFATLAHALQEIAKGEIVRADLTTHAQSALIERDAGEIDSELADVIVQVAMFGEIVFG